MKHYLQTSLCMLALVCMSRISAQSTGYLALADPLNTASFSRIVHTSDNGFITLSTSGSASANKEIIKWDANFHALWSLNFTSAAVLFWQDVIETNDGDYVAFGANQNHGGCNVAIRIDASGTVLWQREYYLSTSFLTAFAVSKAAGNDPGFVIGGGACAASNFVVRCDAGGNILWQKEFLIVGMSGVEAIFAIHAENNAYVLGGEAGNGNTDAYFMRIDSAGLSCSVCTVASSPAHSEIPNRMIRLANGNYALSCTYNSNPNYSALIYLFSNSGTLLNGIKFYNPTNKQIDLRDLTEGPGGKLLTFGTCLDSINPSTLRSRYWYSEISPTGSFTWQQKSQANNPGTSNANGYSICATGNGHFACAGAGAYDGKTIAVIDSSGNGFCNNTNAGILSIVPDAYTPTVPAITQISTSILSLVVNNPYTPMTFTPSTLCGTLGVQERQESSTALTAFPNPTSGTITIAPAGKEFRGASLSVYSVTGEKVLALQGLNGASYTLDLEAFAPGMYFVEVWMDGARSVKRVLRE